MRLGRQTLAFVARATFALIALPTFCWAAAPAAAKTNTVASGSPDASAAQARKLRAKAAARNATTVSADANVPAWMRKTGNLQTSVGAQSPLIWGGSLRYDVNSDFADEREPRLMTNRIGSNIEMTVKNRDDATNPHITLGLDVEAEYTTIGREIDARQQVMEVTDLTGYAMKHWDLGTAVGAMHGFNLSVGATVPTSFRSQFEGYRSMPYADLMHTMGFDEGLFSVIQRFTTAFIANTYEFSPSTRLTNPDFVNTYRLSGGVQLGKGFALGVGGSVRATRSLDGSTIVNWANSQTLSWRNGSFVARLRHTNGNHLTDSDVNLWFIDQYRRLVGLSMMYEF